jgi:outer membrane protein assembly factor BamA
MTGQPLRARPSRIPRTAPVLAILAALLAAPAIRAGIEVQVEGNDRFKSRALKEAVPPDPEKLEEEELATWKEDALFNVEDLYRRAGYFEADVEMDLAPVPGGKPDQWLARLKVKEGPRYAFDTVRVLVHADAGGADALQSRASGGDTAAGAALARLDSAAGRRDSARAALADLRRPADSAQAAAAVAAARDTGRFVSPEALGIEIEADDLAAERGEPFKEELLFEDRRYVLGRFGNAGYVRTQVEERVDVRYGTKTVAVDYLVEPSYPVVFDTLIVIDRRPPPADTSPGITREDLLRSLVPYRKGDTVRVSRNDRVIEKLQYTGAYNFVRLKDSLTGEGGGRSALILLAEERVPGTLRSSLFYETRYKAGVSLDGRHGNLAGTLNEARAGTQMAMRRQYFYAGYGSPLTFGRLIRFDEDLDADWLQDKASNDSGLFDGDFRGSSSTRLTFPWSYWLNLVSNAEVEAKSRLVSADRDRDLNLNFIQTAALSFVNQTMDPTRGLRFAFTWGNGGPLYDRAKGEFNLAEFRHNWLEARTSQYYYYPPLRHFKLATRLDGGRFFGNGESNSERFFLGGSRSVRSYDYISLCTAVDTSGEEDVCVSEGKTLAYVQASAELRAEPFALGFVNPRSLFRHLVPLQVVPFVDWGKVWDLAYEPAETQENVVAHPSKRGYAYGLGFRYPLLGVFNLRVDLVRGTGPETWWIDLAQAF